MGYKGGAIAALEEARRGRSADECWPWPRYVMKATGYGQTTYEGEPWLAHRLAWVVEFGEIPDGMVIDHDCHTRERKTCKAGKDCPHRHCVNPSHLCLVTRARNALDGNSPMSVNDRKTHCKRGHEFTPENTRIIRRKDRADSRECKTCKRAKNRESYRRNDGAAYKRKRYADGYRAPSRRKA